IRKLIKRNCVFLFELPSGEKVLVDGRVIVGRPEERIKRVVKDW
ncbi:MAG: ribonuclease P protein subunit, partial [Thermoprotei archaeon]